MLMNGCSGSGKTNALLNLISHQSNIFKIYLYAKDLYEGNCQLIFNKCKGIALMEFHDSIEFDYCY